MPTSPVDPGRAAAQATASAPSSASCSNRRNSPPDVPQPRTSWTATM